MPIPGNLFNAFDPTFLFCASTLVSVLFVTSDDESKTLSLGLPTAAEAVAYFLDPVMMIGLACLALAIFGVRGSKVKKLSFGESLIANWYLWNGVVIHVMMDGLVGAHGWLPRMNENYRILDRRFRPDLIGTEGGPLATDRALVYVVNEVELFGHSALCFVAFWGVCHRSPWRHSVEAMALAFQFFGSLVFILPELLTGCENTQPIGKSDCSPPLTPFYFFYYYFGVMANFVWTVIPFYLLIKVVQSEVAEKKSLKSKAK